MILLIIYWIIGFWAAGEVLYKNKIIIEFISLLLPRFSLVLAYMMFKDKKHMSSTKKIKGFI